MKERSDVMSCIDCLVRSFSSFLFRRIICPSLVSLPKKQVLLFRKTIPCEFADIAVHCVRPVKDRTRLEDNSVGYKSIHDAIFAAKAIRSSLVKYVEPENFFFFFSESGESLISASHEIEPIDNFLRYGYHVRPCGHDEKKEGCDKCGSYPRAIVICKLLKSDSLNHVEWRKQKYRTSAENCYQVRGLELDEVENLLCG